MTKCQELAKHLAYSRTNEQTVKSEKSLQENGANYTPFNIDDDENYYITCNYQYSPIIIMKSVTRSIMVLKTYCFRNAKTPRAVYIHPGYQSIWHYIIVSLRGCRVYNVFIEV
jgi:hypothetical protein